MIKQELKEQITDAIKENPDSTCIMVRDGVYVTSEGDTTCINGAFRVSDSFEENGVKYTVYFGGKKEVSEPHP